METKKEEPKVIDLNAQAFGEPEVQEEKSLPVEEPKEAQPAPQAKEEEEQKVPYSRFASVSKEKRESERRLREVEQELEEARSRPSYRESAPLDYEEEITKVADAFFGNNEAAKKQYIKIELDKAQRIEEIAERRALDALQRRESSSRSELAENENVLDEQIEDLSLSLGRDLTSDEEDSLLAIADEYSPVGNDGKYLSGQPLPLDRAWKIYQMQIGEKSKSSRKARSQATAATSSKTEAESTSTEEDDKNYRPAWGNWRKRFNS